MNKLELSWSDYCKKKPKLGLLAQQGGVLPGPNLLTEICYCFKIMAVRVKVARIPSGTLAIMIPIKEITASSHL